MTCDPKSTLQSAKSRKMRKRLIEATLDCLQDFGYHRASLSKILDRAGVSKGAWSHHFKNKNELVASAAESMLREAMDNGNSALASLAESGEDDMITTVIDSLWENFEQGKRRDVWMEVYLASRTEMELNRYLVPIIENFHKELNRLWTTHFQAGEDSETPVEILMNLTLFLTRGMAIQSIVNDDPNYYRAFRNQWVNILSPLIKVKRKL